MPRPCWISSAPNPLECSGPVEAPPPPAALCERSPALIALAAGRRRTGATSRREIINLCNSLWRGARAYKQRFVPKLMALASSAISAAPGTMTSKSIPLPSIQPSSAANTAQLGRQPSVCLEQPRERTLTWRQCAQGGPPAYAGRQDLEAGMRPIGQVPSSPTSAALSVAQPALAIGANSSSTSGTTWVKLRSWFATSRSMRRRHSSGRPSAVSTHESEML